MDKTNINEPILTGNDILNGHYNGKMIEGLPITIKRIGTAPRGKYCEGCVHLRAKIDEKMPLARCAFFDVLLFDTEKVELPCGETAEKHLKCVSCALNNKMKDI
jgi:hypothetical protein